jgi:hypothetical protein
MAPGTALTTVLAVNPASLADSRLALTLALLTLGVPRDATANGGDIVEFREQVNGAAERRFETIFDPRGVEGVDTAEWIRRWDDPKWLAANPEHHFTWLKRYAGNAEQLAIWMKTHIPLLVFRRSISGTTERAAYIPEDQLETPRGKELLRLAGIAR